MILRVALASAALGVGLATQASAIPISFHFDGAGNPLGTNVSIASTNVINEPGSTATGLSYSYTPSTGTANAAGGYSGFSGTGLMTVTGGTLNFSFVGSNDGLGGLVAAVLSFSGGTGLYQGVTGTGLLTHTVTSGSTVGGQFTTNVQAVPEPASLAALGLGAFGLMRRVRKGARR